MITQYPEPKTETNETSLQPDQSWKDPVTGMEFVWVEGGSFLMGSPEDDDDADSDEHPAHEVHVDGFWLGKYPVTTDEWKEVMGSIPVSIATWIEDHEMYPFSHDDCMALIDLYNHFFERRCDCPVICVDWKDCQKYITLLNSKGKSVFRLPTEAEWEYAARGGQKIRGYRYAGSDDVNEVACYGIGFDVMRHELGEKLPNELNLYDMSGFVDEWCEDWYDKEYYVSSPRENPICNNDSSEARVVRGGSWNGDARECRSASRSWKWPNSRSDQLGFRLVRLPQD